MCESVDFDFLEYVELLYNILKKIKVYNFFIVGFNVPLDTL